MHEGCGRRSISGIPGQINIFVLEDFVFGFGLCQDLRLKGMFDKGGSVAPPWALIF